MPEMLADIAELNGLGMITLRADLADGDTRVALGRAFGLPMPRVLHVEFGTNAELLWMSPDELLFRCEIGRVPTHLAALSSGMGTRFHSATDVSAARLSFQLTGPHVREVLARLTPADVSIAALPVGVLRRTRLGQVAAGFWLADAQTLNIIAARSYADYMRALLDRACRAPALNLFPARSY